MTNKEKAEKLVRSQPKFRKEDIDGINAGFPAYIFRRSKTREIWTTCCGTHKTIPQECTEEEYEIMMAEHTMEKHWIHGGRPKVIATCPYCGAETMVKELRYTGKRKNLLLYRHVIVLRWFRGALWAMALWAKKDYEDKAHLMDKPQISLTAVYRFKLGKAEAALHQMYAGWSYQSMEGKPKRLPLPIQQPFTYNYFCSEANETVALVGMEELKKSPFRYCCGEKVNGYELIHFLTLCTLYPRQVEMLMKAGMQSVVQDVTYGRRWNARAIDWTQSDPRKAFGLNKQELNAFMATDRDPDTVKIYKQQKKRGDPVSMKQAAELVYYGGKEIVAFCRKNNRKTMKFVQYLRGQDSQGTLHEAYQYWNYYRTAAEAVGLEIWKDNVLFPKNLQKAHDAATQRHQEQLAVERTKAEQERLELLGKSYAERKRKLENKYAFEWDGLLVKIPESGQEIIDEGRILKHCVAGYANRHLQGKRTILFLRHKKNPNKPFITIEMDVNHIEQIHGYRNEGMYTGEGRFAPDPADVHKEFLDIWTAWLKAGSKRNKDGSPKLPEKRKERVA